MASAWRKARAVAVERVRLTRLLSRAGPAGVAALCTVHLVTAVVPALNAVATGWLVHVVAVSAAEGRGLAPAVAPLVAVAALLVVGQAAELAHQIVGIGVARRIDGWMRHQVRGVALSPPDIAHLEDAEFHDDVTRAADLGGQGGRRRSPGTAVTGQVVLVFRIVGALLAAAVLARFSVLLAVGLLAASLTARAIVRRQWMYLADVMDAGIADKRRADYWADLAAGVGAAKEVRLFGLGDWLTTKWRAAVLVRLDRIWAERRGVLRRQGPVIALAFGGALAALMWPGIAAAQREIDAGALVTYLVAAWGVFVISSMGYEAFDIEYGKGAVRAYDRLTARHVAPVAAPAEPATAVTPALRLEDVGFTYPGSSRPVLDGLTVDIPAGQVLAVVGHNGAGKTTLMKLLAGLYRPTRGRIVVDGSDLADLDVERWRGRMTAVFQDFVHYPASVRDNIALSAPTHLSDVDGVERVVRQAGASEMVAPLPRGLETPLWRGATGGVDVSGGQWQKLALARALFAVAHGRRLLVLDEPTAHLDVRAEAEFYESVVAAVNGVTVVLISHRLSTVRRADRILLLDGGRVAESGTHDDLMALDGRYARLFRLQASRFDGQPEASGAPA